MESAFPKRSLSGSKNRATGIASNEQQPKMVKNCDHVGTSDNLGKVEKLLEGKVVASSVAIREDKKETIAAANGSLPPTSWHFPCRLMDMINWCESDEAEKEGISLLICWSPDGKYFTINDQEKLSEHVLRRFFKDSKFGSFRRKLYRWGFKQVTCKIDARRQGDVSFRVDGFERNDPNSCSKLKVRYSKKENDERRQKSLEAKQKKMEKQSNAGTSDERRKNTPEQDTSLHRLGAPCSQIVSGAGVLTVPLEILPASRASLAFAPEVMFSNNAHVNYSCQVGLAQMLALRQSELQAGYLPSLRQHLSPTRNPYSAAFSCQLISQQEGSLLTKLANLMELRKMDENISTLQYICKSCELQQLGHSMQLFSSIARASSGVHLPAMQPDSRAASLPEASYSHALSQVQVIRSDLAAARMMGSPRGRW
jgi:hypothetical protein